MGRGASLEVGPNRATGVGDLPQEMDLGVGDVLHLDNEELIRGDLLTLFANESDATRYREPVGQSQREPHLEQLRGEAQRGQSKEVQGLVDGQKIASKADPEVV